MRLQNQMLLLAADRRGNFGVITAILLPVLLGSAGFAMDVSGAMTARSQLQEATDAAALAAATSLARDTSATETSAKALALDFMSAQLSGTADAATNQKILNGTTVSITTTTSSSGKSYKIAITSSYAYNLSTLMGVFGYKTMNVAAKSSSSSGISETQSALSMTLVLDESGSMLAPTGTVDTTQSKCVEYTTSGTPANKDSKGNAVATGPCYIKKIDALKTAAGLLLDQLDKADPNSDFVRTNAIAWSSKVQLSSTFTWGTTKTRTSVISKMSAGGGTESAAPMLKAYTDLNTTGTGSETKIQSDAGNTSLTKYIVFMTDGENNASSSDTKTLATCTAAKDAGMKIYSIAFMAPTAGQSLLTQCSSGTGYYFKAESMADLLSAFKAIGNSAAADKTLLTQ